MGENVNNKLENPVLHVLVVGFHHKKGCQVEYSYPPLVPGTDPENNECPPGWKYLPTLALPDGSHNYDQDTVYFHLPSLTDPDKTVFGISCFRQIPVEKLKNRTADITRGTVQKSVCVLSTVPLYGHIQVKMSLITHAYFEEGDFTKVSLLKDTYHHLNSCLNQIDDLQNASQLFVGLSGRELILHWRHKAVLLFKLLLLERKVVFYRSPVQPLCSTILSLLSLHPGMMETGLYNSACVQPSRPMSPVPHFVNFDKRNKTESNTKSVPINQVTVETVDCTTNLHSKDISPIKTDDNNIKDDINNDIVISNDEKCDVMKTCIKDEENNKIIASDISDNNILICNSNNKNVVNNEIGDTDTMVCDISNGYDDDDKISANYCDFNPLYDSSSDNPDKVIKNVGDIDEEATDVLTFYDNHFTKNDQNGDDKNNDVVSNLPRDISVETLGETTAQNNMVLISQINAQLCGVPLPIFTEGYLCMPYLSLPYMDLLTDKNVRGYVVGATNVLFKQKKRLADILVEVEGAKIETGDLELRRLLHLTTEDLRFADFLVRHVAEERHDVFLDGVGWEGGDEWIRAQFRVYLLCLLRTSLLQEGSRELDHFNSAFISAWRQTASYKAWLDNAAARDGILEINPGHPFAGQLSVADMKLRLAHTMQNTEGGRKLNQAVMSTGRAVATTGRAVGGAISQAKGALSNWWSNLTTAQSPTDPTNGINPPMTSITDETSAAPSESASALQQQQSVNPVKPPTTNTTKGCRNKPLMLRKGAIRSPKKLFKSLTKERLN